MIGNHTRLLFAACSLLALAVTTDALSDLRIGDPDTETRLPKPLSDLSASVGPDGLIYITGGCDSPFGSQYSEEAETFRCNSVSDSFYAFDPETEEFTVLPAMPTPRYRHASVAINNQIWLVGGRDADDELVGTVVVYDLGDERWRTFRDLHDTYWVSDLGGFAARGRAFFVGGFSEDYRALRKVFSIDPVASWDTGRLQIVRNANLIDRRGDVGVTVDEDERYAYVSGGSSHTNQFCAPLDSVERYDLENNEWVPVAPLQQARTGKSVIQIQDQLVALGGAQQIGKLCDKTNPDPSQFQTPVYSIEVYEEGQWDVVDSLSEYHFRSTSVVYNNTVYSFGGQSVYFTVCMCHPTVDDVVIYQLASEDPAAPDYWVSTETESYPDPTFQSQPEIDTDSSTGEIVERDGTNSDSPKEGEEEGASNEENKQTGYGAYHRDGFNGFIASSGALMASVNAILPIAIGVLAVLVM